MVHFFSLTNCLSVCSQSVIEALKVIGHRVTDYEYFFNVVNAVAKEDGCITAVSDARKQGKSAGY